MAAEGVTEREAFEPGTEARSVECVEKGAEVYSQSVSGMISV